MPYVEQEWRKLYDENLEKFVISNTGNLNYCVTQLVNKFLCTRMTNYDSINAAIGVLECAKQELYRRVAVPYEDKKIKENGDVY